MNVFHWHLTDDQGFRIESRRFPKLHQLGSDGLYYTQAQVRDVIATPASAASASCPSSTCPATRRRWFVGYPGAGGRARALRDRAASGGSSTHVRSHAARRSTRSSSSSSARWPALFPDAYLHIGGDEVNGQQWNASPTIQAFMHEHGLADNEALQAYFNAPLARSSGARQEDGGLGRDPPSRPAEGHRGPVLAGTRVARPRPRAGLRRASSPTATTSTTCSTAAASTTPWIRCRPDRDLTPTQRPACSAARPACGRSS